MTTRIAAAALALAASLTAADAATFSYAFQDMTFADAADGSPYAVAASGIVRTDDGFAFRDPLDFENYQQFFDRVVAASATGRDRSYDTDAGAVTEVYYIWEDGLQVAFGFDLRVPLGPRADPDIESDAFAGLTVNFERSVVDALRALGPGGTVTLGPRRAYEEELAFDAETSDYVPGLQRTLGRRASGTVQFVRIDDVAPVPLPAGGLLLMGSLGALAALRRRR